MLCERRGGFGGGGGGERRKEAVVQASPVKNSLRVCWIYLDFCAVAVDVCHLFGIILFSKSQAPVELEPGFNGAWFVVFRQWGEHRPPKSLVDQALTFVLIMDSRRNGETCWGEKIKN